MIRVRGPGLKISCFGVSDLRFRGRRPWVWRKAVQRLGMASLTVSSSLQLRRALYARMGVDSVMEEWPVHDPSVPGGVRNHPPSLVALGPGFPNPDPLTRSGQSAISPCLKGAGITPNPHNL